MCVVSKINIDISFICQDQHFLVVILEGKALGSLDFDRLPLLWVPLDPVWDLQEMFGG